MVPVLFDRCPFDTVPTDPVPELPACPAAVTFGGYREATAAKIYNAFKASLPAITGLRFLKCRLHRMYTVSRASAWLIRWPRWLQPAVALISGHDLADARTQCDWLSIRHPPFALRQGVLPGTLTQSWRHILQLAMQGLRTAFAQTDSASSTLCAG
jgi:hypothetical protein